MEVARPGLDASKGVIGGGRRCPKWNRLFEATPRAVDAQQAVAGGELRVAHGGQRWRRRGAVALERRRSRTSVRMGKR